MGVAAALGLLVARAALAPVRRLTETTEAVTETRDLSQRIESTSTGDDELGRLATSFNTMLARARGLEPRAAAARRRRLARAAHAAHEPADEHRGARARERAARRRRASSCSRDVVEQIDEMTALIGELIELAREARPDAVVEPARDVRLDLVAADAIERTRRNRPGDRVRDRPGRVDRLRRARRRSSARSPTCSTTRPSGARPAGTVEVAVRQGERLGARPRPGDRRRGPAVRVRPLLPLAHRARDARLGARARDRQAGGRVARRLGRRRAAARTAGR